MNQSIIWSIPSDFPFDDRAETHLGAHLGLMFHGASSLGAHTIGHRFLHDDGKGSLLLRVIIRTDESFVVQMVSLGDLDFELFDFTEWMVRTKVAMQKQSNMTVFHENRGKEFPERIPLTEASGNFFRITPPNVDPLKLPKSALFSGQFHREGDSPILYATSSLSDACLELIAKHGAAFREVAFGIRRRVSHLYLDSALVLDLRTSANFALGTTVIDPSHSDVTRRIASQARDFGAEGLLVPTKYSTEAVNLVLFGHALHHVTVLETEIRSLGLADAAPDGPAKNRFKNEPRVVNDFVTALEDGRFEHWLATLDAADDERQSFRELANLLFGLSLVEKTVP
ncbi:RES family NAD+ phosphorylase [Kocuria marina]|uniref:RES family NAD+ phosphorylase n=1 Tax=Kocuria marina TaxID=223184 RepID=UPI0019D15BCF|nr:RES family NAD+ phosphorylase [Kocuria indica]MBN6812940.1 RES family NAD+ phosphorylase [Kocuria indica]MBN6844665.1 RES family NAD+ phosphorylase [Kocuria indica]